MLLCVPPCEISGIPVETDFKFWLKHVGMVLDSCELHAFEKPGIILHNVFGKALSQEPEEQVVLLSAVMDFYNCGRQDRELKPPKETLLHWMLDSPCIWADFYIHLHINLDAEDMHWWEFYSLFESLPASSRIKTLMQIRNTDLGKYKGEEREEMRERKKAAAVWPADEPDFYMTTGSA